MTSKEIIQKIIVKLEDDLQHYTMVDIDIVKAKYIELEIKDYKQILQDLERLEVLEQSYKKVVESIVHYEYTKQRLENEKLKKVIEILKDKLGLKAKYSKSFFSDKIEDYYLDAYSDIHIDYTISLQEYELLKEVLENEES